MLFIHIIALCDTYNRFHKWLYSCLYCSKVCKKSGTNRFVTPSDWQACQRFDRHIFLTFDSLLHAQCLALEIDFLNTFEYFHV